MVRSVYEDHEQVSTDGSSRIDRNYTELRWILDSGFLCDVSSYLVPHLLRERSVWSDMEQSTLVKVPFLVTI